MSKQEFSCSCIPRYGEREVYFFSLFENAPNWFVQMKNRENTGYSEAIDLKLTPFAENTLRITDMYIDDLTFREQGIIEALICKVSTLLNKKIVSSARDVENQDYRSNKAERFWQHMVSSEWAVYDNNEYRYRWVAKNLCDY